MALTVAILGLNATGAAEAGTTTTNIKITGHNLVAGDMIVNTTRSTADSPASRIVTAIVDADNFTVTAITGQVVTDEIKTFKFIDRTSLLKKQTLIIRRRTDHRNTAEFEIDTTSAFIPLPGQNVKIYDGATTYFGGTIQTAKMVRTAEKGTSSTTNIIVRVSCDSYNHIAGRRSVAITYDVETTAETIMKAMVDAPNGYLYQEGIRYLDADIDVGATFNEYPEFAYKAMSIKQVFDDMASASGYVWWIDDDRYLHFNAGGTPGAAAHTLEDGGVFEDYKNVTVEDTMVNYRNKQFILGAQDEIYTDNIVVWSQVDAQITARQASEGNSGIYGHIASDENIDQATEMTAEAGTNTTQIVMTGHSLVVGDMVVNITRNNEKRVVKTVPDANTITVNAVTGQTNGDLINWYPDANTVLRNNLKRYGKAIPKSLEFDSDTNDWAEGTKLTVNLAAFGNSTSPACYWLIEEVEITDLDGEHLRSHITATLRDNSDFSGQYSANWADAFESFQGGGGPSGGKTYVTNVYNTANNIRLFVGPDAPNNPRENDLWIETDAAYTKYTDHLAEYTPGHDLVFDNDATFAGTITVNNAATFSSTATFIDLTISNAGVSALTIWDTVGNNYAGLFLRMGVFSTDDKAEFYIINDGTYCKYQTYHNSTTRNIHLCEYTGRVSLYESFPTAWLLLPAGLANAGYAPLKFQSGTNNTAPEAGAVEYDGTDWFFTNGVARYYLPRSTTTGLSPTFTSIKSGSATQGVSLSGSTAGVLTMAGFGNTNNESFTIDCETYADFVALQSTVTIAVVDTLFWCYQSAGSAVTAYGGQSAKGNLAFPESGGSGQHSYWLDDGVTATDYMFLCHVNLSDVATRGTGVGVGIHGDGQRAYLAECRDTTQAVATPYCYLAKDVGDGTNHSGVAHYFTAQRIESSALKTLFDIDHEGKMTVGIGDSTLATLGVVDQVTNGTFTGNANGWTLGTGWSYNANNVIHAGAAGYLDQDINIVAGNTYRVTFTISGITQGSIKPYAGSTVGLTYTTNNTHIAYITCYSTSGSDSLRFLASANCDAVIDTVLCYIVTPSTANIVYANTEEYIGCEMRFDGNSSATAPKDNVIFGRYAGLGINGATSGDSYRNVAIGAYSMGGRGSYGIGSFGVASGYDSLAYNTADNNVAYGYQSGFSNTTGGGNFYMGFKAGYSNQAGSRIMAFGYEALYTCTATGNVSSIALGYQAAKLTTSGTNLVGIGEQALYSNTTGGNHVAVGYQAGYSNTTGTGGIYIGYQAGYNETASNMLYIHNTNTAYPLIYGDLSNRYCYIHGDFKVRADGATTVYFAVDNSTGIASTMDIQPIADNTYYIGKNDDDTPLAFKGVILKDTTDGKYYRVEVINGVVTATDLTD